MEICNILRGQFYIMEVSFSVIDSITKEEKSMEKLMTVSPDGETIVSLQGGVAYNRKWLETQVHTVKRCRVVKGVQYVGKGIEKYKEMTRAGGIFVQEGKPRMLVKHHSKNPSGHSWLNMTTGEVTPEPQIGKNNKLMAVKNIKYVVETP